MAKINVITVGHGSKTEHYAGSTAIQYNVFPAVTVSEKSRLKKISEAHKIIDSLDAKIDLQGPCNMYFRTLPKSKTFRQY